MKIVRADALSYIPASHEDPAAPGVLKRVLLSRSELRGTPQMINWSKLPARKAFCPHLHESMEEVFIMMKGRAEIEIDGECALLGRGDAVVVPPHSRHSMRNTTEEDVEFLAIGFAVA